MPHTYPQQSVLDVSVSWFEGATPDANGEPQYNPQPGGIAPLLRLIQPTNPATLVAIEAIRREPDPARRKALKSRLPAFTPSGQFTRRGAAHLPTVTQQKQEVLYRFCFNTDDNDPFAPGCEVCFHPMFFEYLNLKHEEQYVVNQLTWEMFA